MRVIQVFIVGTFLAFAVAIYGNAGTSLNPSGTMNEDTARERTLDERITALEKRISNLEERCGEQIYRWQRCSP